MSHRVYGSLFPKRLSLSATTSAIELCHVGHAGFAVRTPT